MRTEMSRSQNRAPQFRNADFTTFEEQLIENYPILVRGVVAESDVPQEIADAIIAKYPTFVRGIVEAFQAGEIDDEEWENSSDTRLARDTSDDDSSDGRGRVTDPAHDHRLKKNRRGSRGGRSRRSVQ